MDWTTETDQDRIFEDGTRCLCEQTVNNALQQWYILTFK